jgi:uncharacterized protein YndB with AHSA1/START domain
VNASQPSSPGDQARVSLQVAVAPSDAFRIFTEEIDGWWRRAPMYRPAGHRAGTMQLETRMGGRLRESFEQDGRPQEIEIGIVTTWDPPSRLVLDWRAINFTADEKTEVEITFEPRGGGTLVTVTHRGWSAIRADHPVRHGKETAGFLAMLGMWWSQLLTSLRVRTAGG